MSKKIIFGVLTVLCWWGITFPASIGAEDKSGRPVTIGVLLFSENNLRALDAFKAGLQELGYVEGRDVIFLFNGAVKKSHELDTQCDLSTKDHGPAGVHHVLRRGQGKPSPRP